MSQDFTLTKKGRELNRIGLFIVRIIVLFSVCALPACDLLHKRTIKKISTNDNSQILYLNTGDIIEQKLHLGNGEKLTALALKTTTLPEQATKESEFKANLSIKQGDKSLSVDLDQDNWAIYTKIIWPRFQTSQFRNQPIDIIIEVEEITGDVQYGILLSDNIVRGVSACTVNGETQSFSLLLDGEIRSWQYEGVISSVIFIIIILILSALMSYVITYCAQKNYYQHLFLGASFLLIITTICLLYPSFSWQGTPLSESIFFYRDVITQNPWRYFTTLEGGMYLSTYNRILMFFVVKVLHAGAYTFYVIQAINTLFIGLIATLFCTSYYRKYFSDDFRLLISITLGCYFFSAWMYWFVGTAYLGVILIIYALTNDFSKKQASWILTCIGCAILCLSKMMFVVFVPTSAFLLIFGRKILAQKTKTVLWIISIFGLLEAVLSCIIKGSISGGEWDVGTLTLISPIQLIIGSCYYTTQMFISTIAPSFSLPNNIYTNFVFTFLLLVFVCYIYHLFSNKQHQKTILLITAFAITITSNCALLMISGGTLSVGDVSPTKINLINQSTKYMWWYTFSFASVGAICLVVLYLLKENYKKIFTDQPYSKVLSIITSYILCTFIINQYASSALYKDKNFFTIPSKAYNFADYFDIQNHDHFLIPINSSRFIYNKATRVITTKLKQNTNRIDVGNFIEETDQLVSVYVLKSSYTNQILSCKYRVKVFDKYQNLLTTAEQLDSNTSHEQILFDFTTPIPKVDTLKFECEDNEPAYINGEVMFAVKE